VWLYQLSPAVDARGLLGHRRGDDIVTAPAGPRAIALHHSFRLATCSLERHSARKRIAGESRTRGVGWRRGARCAKVAAP
jgi:hypothetical protein